MFKLQNNLLKKYLKKNINIIYIVYLNVYNYNLIQCLQNDVKML